VLGVSRTHYYRTTTKQQAKDAQDVAVLRTVHTEHPFYGVARLAIHLGWSEVKTRRIRILAGIVVPTASKKYRYRKGGRPEIPAPANALQAYAAFKDKAKPQAGMDYSGMTRSGAWAQDFTYLKFHGAWYYLAGVLDLRTRQIVGWRLGANHSSELTYAAVLDALSKYEPPAILHSDQGSEYLSYKHQELCVKLEIQLSASGRGKPWQNGFMERWFGGFKLEIGDYTKFNDISQLHEAIALRIFYYNTRRIHTALKMSPAAYAARLKLTLKRKDKVLQKVRG
jgi:transposase InsO family protein